jgi:ferric-dicitrate binding protein FerR (iron transport regulator)
MTSTAQTPFSPRRRVLTRRTASIVLAGATAILLAGAVVPLHGGGALPPTSHATAVGQVGPAPPPTPPPPS